MRGRYDWNKRFLRIDCQMTKVTVTGVCVFAQVELEFLDEREPLTVPFNVSANDTLSGRRRLHEGADRGERARRVLNDELIGARGSISNGRQLQSSTQARCLAVFVGSRSFTRTMAISCLVYGRLTNSFSGSRLDKNNI